MKLVINAVLLSVSLLSVIVNAQPYGPERERARNRAVDSSKQIEKMYQQVYAELTKKGVSGEIAHDDYAVKLFEVGYKQWTELRDMQCALDAQIQIYPSESLLYMQVYNGCVTAENKKYKRYLKNIKNQINAANM